MQILKQDILNLLNHLGVGTEVYIVTITRAWLLTIRCYMEITDYCDSFGIFISHNKSQLDTRLLHAYYSENLLYSTQAKKRYVEADIQKIPGYD